MATRQPSWSGIASTPANWLASRLQQRTQDYLGALVLMLWWADQRRALGILLLTLGAIRVADFLITLAAGGAGLAKASEHLLGLVVLPLGVYLRRADRRRALRHPVAGAGKGQR
jgi:Domain of unknown function (DUF4267)